MTQQRPHTTRRRVLQALSTTVAGVALLNQTRISTAQTATDGSWPRTGFDAGNTRYAPNNTGPTTDISEAWHFETKGRITGPVVAGGTVVFASGSTVHALEARDGSEKWKREMDNDIDTSPTIVDSAVFVADENKVFALSISDGTEQWQFEANGSEPQTLAVVDNTVIFGTDDGTVSALDKDQGTERWSFKTGNSVRDPPAVIDGTVYVGSFDTQVYALDAEDGSKQWSFQTKDMVNSSPTVANGMVYVESGGDSFKRGGEPVGGETERGTLYALDAATGNEQWSLQKDGQLYSISVAKEKVYVWLTGLPLFALDSSDGTERWSKDVLGVNPVVADKTVFAAGLDTMIALDAENGTQRWVYEMDSDRYFGDPAVVGGRIYVSSEPREGNTGMIHSFAPSSSVSLDKQQSRDEGSSGDIPVLTQFGDSGTSLGLGIGLLGVIGGGSYAAYRKFVSDGENDSQM